MPSGIYLHKKLTKERKEKISKTLKGVTPWNKGKKVASHYKNSRKGKGVVCPKCSKKTYRYPSQVGKYNNFCSKKCWYKYNSGSNNPMFGKKHTKEALEKNRQKHLGKKLKDLTKNKIRQASIKNARCGPDSHFWKGGISGLQNRLRNTSQYKEWRRTVFKRDAYKCQYKKCLSNKDLVGHHLKEFGKILKEHEINNFKEALERYSETE